MNAGAAPTSRHRQDEGDEPVAPGGRAGRGRGCRGDAALSVRFCCEPKTAVEIKAQKQKQPRHAKPVESRDREMRSGRGHRVCHADFPATSFSPRGLRAQCRRGARPAHRSPWGQRGRGASAAVRGRRWGGPPPRGGRRDTGQGRRGPWAGLRGLSMRFVFKVLRS